MKQKLLVPIFLLCCLNAFGQNEYNKWYFGSAGLDFNYDPPKAIAEPSWFSSIEASSGVCDTAGNLLFYTDGDYVWNGMFQEMKYNNQSGMADYFHSTSIHGALVIKKPSTEHQYYIFSAQSYPKYDTDHYLRYSLVDMERENGRGEVMVMNEPLLPEPKENLVVTFHANGQDIWIGAINYIDGKFNCIPTQNGLFGSVVTTDVGATGNVVMCSKLSPDSKVLIAFCEYNINGGFLHIYHFNNLTGRLSDKLVVKARGGVHNSVLEFSHDSRYLYIGQSDGSIEQYDLLNWDKDIIEKSAFYLFKGSGSAWTGMQLGPNKKIYLFDWLGKNLSVINSPWKAGTASNLKLNEIDLLGKYNQYGGPFFPNFHFRKTIVNLSGDSIMCEGDSARLQYKPLAKGKIKWNTGDTTSIIYVKTEGWFTAALINATDTIVDSLEVRLGPRAKVFIGSDTSFCGLFSHQLNAGSGKKSYNWNSGDTTVSILVNRPGMYSVRVTDTISCPNADTILIDQLMRPEVTILYDSSQCKSVYLKRPPAQNGVEYLWSTGDTGEVIEVFVKGKYGLVAKNKFCSITKNINVDKLSTPEVDLGQDTGFCHSSQIILSCNDGNEFLWNTGAVTRSVKIMNKGTYWVTIKRNGCTASDTIVVTDDCDVLYFIPNAFSPNSDGMNDVFKVGGENIQWVDMDIYNQWGEKIAEESGINPYWDGTFKGKPCSPDVYVYMITITSMDRGISIVKQVSGNLTLMR